MALNLKQISAVVQSSSVLWVVHHMWPLCFPAATKNIYKCLNKWCLISMSCGCRRFINNIVVLKQRDWCSFWYSLSKYKTSKLTGFSHVGSRIGVKEALWWQRPPLQSSRMGVKWRQARYTVYSHQITRVNNPRCFNKASCLLQWQSN